MDKKEIVLFTDGNVALEVPITPEQDTVWLYSGSVVKTKI